MTVVARNIIEFNSKLDLGSVLLNDSDKNRAIDVLKNTHLPTTRDEQWKYTRLGKLNKIEFQNIDGRIDSLDKFKIDDSCATLVFINGYFSREHSSKNIPEGISSKLISENTDLNKVNCKVKIDGEVFNALNTAYLTDGVIIDIKEKFHVESPLQIIHVLSGSHVISNYKTIINIGPSSEATIIEGFFCEQGESNFCNYVSEINVEENSKLTIDKIQYESESSFHICTEQIEQRSNSTFTLNTITLNGGLVRNNVNVNVVGQNCTTNLNGAYLLKNAQHVDNHTVIDHQVANCNSNELYKGVMNDKSTAVFNGKVYVRPDAQRINAFQSNGNVLLSDSATVNSKPELEIYADDVKCSHGSTTGQLDEEAVFYLRARGLSETSARKLMTAAFMGDVFTKIESKAVRLFVERLLKDRFDWDN